MLEAGTKAALLAAASWKLWPLTEAPPRPTKPHLTSPQGEEFRDLGEVLEGGRDASSPRGGMRIMERIMRGIRIKKMVVIIILFCLVIKSGAKIIWEKGWRLISIDEFRKSCNFF